MVRHVLAFTFLIAQKMTPFIFRLCWAGLQWTTLSMVAFWSGVPQAAGQIADHWTPIAVDATGLRLYDRQIRQFMVVLAYVMIVTGWILLAFITVFIVRIIF